MLFENSFSREYKNPECSDVSGAYSAPDPQVVFGLTGPHHFLILSDGPIDCKPEHTEMAYVSSWMSGKETSTKKLYFHKEKIDKTL